MHQQSCKSMYSYHEEEIMNIQKFTQKSIEAVSGCEKIAVEYAFQDFHPGPCLVSPGLESPQLFIL